MKLSRLISLFGVHFSGRRALTVFLLALFVVSTVGLQATSGLSDSDFYFLSILMALVFCYLSGMEQYLNRRSCITLQLLPATTQEKWFCGWLWTAVLVPLIFLIAVYVLHFLLSVFFTDTESIRTYRLFRHTTLKCFLVLYWTLQAPLYLGTFFFRRSPIVSTLMLLAFLAVFLWVFVTKLVAIALLAFWGKRTATMGSDLGPVFENLIRVLDYIFSFPIPQVAFVLVCWSLSWFLFKQYEAR